MSVEETQEQLLARHRKERKDLTNQITSLKKQASKKTRKQVNARCLELEQELEARHKSELAQLNGEQVSDGSQENEITPEMLLQQLNLDNGNAGASNPESTATVVPAGTTSTPNTEVSTDAQPSGQGKKRRNRQKERLAKREAEIARIKEEALKEAAEQPNLKEIEQTALDELCDVLKLKQIDIQPDGHCLFNSILDQLKVRHAGDVSYDYDFPEQYKGAVNITEIDVSSLRSLSACYIREHRDDFIPYLFDENTMTIKDLDEYTKTMETTAEWGGEVEILALSKVFGCPISILMSGRSTYKINEGAKNPELKLVYYKHSYTLGEHYNSLHDL